MQELDAILLPARPPEETLIERARSDPEAFAGIYLAHYQAIAGLIYRRTGDQHLTEDLAADVFLAAYRAIPRYRASEVPLRSWLMRIATNRVNRWARRRRGLAEILTRLARLRPTWQLDRRGETDYSGALAALLGLPPDLQAVVSLHHLEGLGVGEVALVLECPVGTVKSRLSRARDAMRSRLLAEGDHR